MEAVRVRESVALLQKIFDERQSITSANQLWELARRTAEGKRLRIGDRQGLKLAEAFMSDEGRG